MRDVLKIALGIVIGFLALVGLCSLCIMGVVLFAATQPTPTPTLTPTPTFTPTPSGVIPPAGTMEPTPTTASGALGQSFRYDSLLITPLEYQFGGAYKTKWGSPEAPPEGAKFLWIKIAVENVGENADYSPHSSNFKVLHKGTEISTPWRWELREPADRPLYEGWEQIYPGVRKEGWIRFTVPERAKPEDLLLVFEPTSDVKVTWRLQQ
jgi:hypothetical protein